VLPYPSNISWAEEWHFCIWSESSIPWLLRHSCLRSWSLLLKSRWYFNRIYCHCMRCTLRKRFMKLLLIFCFILICVKVDCFGSEVFRSFRIKWNSLQFLWFQDLLNFDLWRPEPQGLIDNFYNWIFFVSECLDFWNWWAVSLYCTYWSYWLRALGWQLWPLHPLRWHELLQVWIIMLTLVIFDWHKCLMFVKFVWNQFLEGWLCNVIIFDSSWRSLNMVDTFLQRWELTITSFMLVKTTEAIVSIIH